jgi:hypothetical protein
VEIIKTAIVYIKLNGGGLFLDLQSSSLGNQFGSILCAKLLLAHDKKTQSEMVTGGNRNVAHRRKKGLGFFTQS